jgi:small Trp-rich protein
MVLAVIAVLILLMKLADIGPVATWSWWYVMLPFVVLFIWWEFVSKWMGSEKRAAEKKMKEEQKLQQEWKKKTRGF